MGSSADLVILLKKNSRPHARPMPTWPSSRAWPSPASSVNRMLAKGDMPLSRIDAICRALKMDFAELAGRVAQDVAQQHQADQKLADKDREGYTLLLAIALSDPDLLHI